jgi:hypothetical protein
VLKDGILMAAQGARRVTRDADLSAHGLSNDEALLGATVAAIAALPADDGLRFDVGSIATESMREDAAYHGVRVKLDARLATAKPKVALDFADVWVLSRQHALPADELYGHLSDVAEHRGHLLVPLARALEHMPDRQGPYTRMLQRNAYERALPAQWTELLEELKAFVDPLVTSPGALTSRDPNSLGWS